MSEEAAPQTTEQNAAPESQSSAAPSIFSEGLNFSDGWYESIQSPEFDPHRSMAAQFRDLPSVFKSLHETKAALSQRQDGMVKIPGESATDEERAAFNKAMGIPGSLDEYEIAIPEQLPEGVELTPDSLLGFREFAYQHGIPPKTASALVAFQIQAESAAIAQIQADQQAQAQEAQQALNREWGGQYEQKMMLAQRAAETFGLGADHPAMQSPDVLRAMALAASKISESSLVSGERIGASLTPGSEARDIMANPDNPLHSAYHDPTHPNHETAYRTYMQKMEEQSRRDGFAT